MSAYIAISLLEPVSMVCNATAVTAGNTGFATWVRLANYILFNNHSHNLYIYINNVSI